MPYVERRGEDLIAVDVQYTEREQVKTLPGSRWDPETKTWTLPLTWASCVQLRGVFGQSLQVGPQLTAWSVEEHRRRIAPALDMRAKLRLPNDVTINTHLNDKVTPYDFQLCGVGFLTTAGSALLGDDMGVGKTIQALAALGPDALPALVITPNSVKTAWARSADHWHKVAVPYVVTGGAAQRRRILKEAREDPHALVILNIEAVRLFSRLAPFGNVSLARCRECDPRHGNEQLTASRCEVHPKELNTFGFKTVILDEAHKIKEPRSKQTRAVWAVGHGSTVRTRWALTGTPIANHVGDLWSIMHFVAPDEYPTKSKFVDRYSLQSWNAFGGLDIVGINPTTRDEFFKILDPRYRRTPKQLVLSQLPQKIRSTRWVDMSSKQQKAYDDMETRLMTIMPDGQVFSASDNLVKTTRLMQLASSFAEVEWTEEPEVKPNDTCYCAEQGMPEHEQFCMKRWKIHVTLCEPSPKLDALEDIIEERGGRPLVVAAQSAQLINLAANRLKKSGVRYGRIVGDVSEYDRQQVIDRFNRDQIQVVLMTIDAGGTGVDGLQHSDTLVVLQRSWKMVANVQLEARVDRIGSEKHDSVHIIDVVTRGTIEEAKLFPRMQEKFHRLEQIHRDTARFLEAGLQPPEMFTLQREEAAIMASDMGAA